MCVTEEGRQLSYYALRDREVEKAVPWEGGRQKVMNGKGEVTFKADQGSTIVRTKTRNGGPDFSHFKRERSMNRGVKGRAPQFWYEEGGHLAPSSQK